MGNFVGIPGRRRRRPVPHRPTSVKLIRSTMGEAAGPIVLSYDQRLFSFMPWRNWLPPDRLAASALILWDARHFQLQHLASLRDPTAFADATADAPTSSLHRRSSCCRRADPPGVGRRDGVFVHAQPVRSSRFAVTKVTSRILVAVRLPGT